MYYYKKLSLLISLLLFLSLVAYCSNSTALTAQLPHYSHPYASTTSENEPQQLKLQMLKLERLTLAMAEHEGWAGPGQTATPGGTASYRRHNPGNLRSSPFEIGKENNFSVFNTDADGFAAFRWDIRQKALGNTRTGLNGNSTLAELIHKWAPASDGNNPDAYLQHVLSMTGFSASMKLSELLH